MKLGTFTQQPNERNSFTINYADSLFDDDYIVSAAIKAIAPAGLLVDQLTILDDSRVVPTLKQSRLRYFVASGVTATTYKVTLSVTTADGRVFEDEVIFKIKEL